MRTEQEFSTEAVKEGCTQQGSAFPRKAQLCCHPFPGSLTAHRHGGHLPWGHSCRSGLQEVPGLELSTDGQTAPSFAGPGGPPAGSQLQEASRTGGGASVRSALSPDSHRPRCPLEL